MMSKMSFPVGAGVGSAAALIIVLALAPALASPRPPQDAPQDGKKAEPEYIGANGCRKCHGDQVKSWKKTKMASAFDLLKPGERAEHKVEAGLDPKKDYTRDETCLPCHTTGWGKPGGYFIPPEGDTPEARKAQKRAAALEGVQCEACHGPASLVVELKRKNEKYQWAEIVEQGLLDGVRFPQVENCDTCHNTDSPFVGDDYVFDFETRKEQGTHQHYRMDFDHGCPHKHTVSKRKRKKKK